MSQITASSIHHEIHKKFQGWDKHRVGFTLSLSPPECIALFQCATNMCFLVLTANGF